MLAAHVVHPVHKVGSVAVRGLRIGLVLDRGEQSVEVILPKGDGAAVVLQGKINDEGNGFTAKMEDFKLIGQVVSQPLPMARASLADASRTVVAAANAGFADENSLVANLSTFGVIDSSLDAKLADPATLVVRAWREGLFRPARELIA